MVTQCKPLTKDHLLLTTAFVGTKGWSVVSGFTVLRARSRKGLGGGFQMPLSRSLSLSNPIYRVFSRAFYLELS